MTHPWVVGRAPCLRERDIRRALHAELTAKHGSSTDTLLIEELGILQGAARVDLAVVNGFLHGYEIKSEQDTLARLQDQSVAYGKVFDYVTIVCAGRHFASAVSRVPHWWGVAVAVGSEHQPSIAIDREATRNQGVEPRALVELLWRDECIAILKERGLERGLLGGPRSRMWDRLAEAIAAIELSSIVRDQLKRRERWRPEPPPASGGG